MRTTEKLLTTAIAGAVAVSLTALTAAVQSGPSYEGPPQPSAAQGLEHADPSDADRGGDDARQSIPAGATADGPPAAEPLPPSTPHTVRIPTIDVAAPLTGLGLDSDGSLRVPPEADPNLAAWFHGGVTPGAEGTALINGHVDNASGPAVFYRLGALRRGDTIEIERADGRTAVFTVDAVEVFDRNDFPDELVYADNGQPELRLITCGGGFSEAAGGYTGNVVVFAHLSDNH